jgi:hypothetical protein
VIGVPNRARGVIGETSLKLKEVEDGVAVDAVVEGIAVPGFEIDKSGDSFRVTAPDGT